MALPDAQSVATKWVQRTSAASQDYISGVQNTDKDPTALAIASGPRYLQRVQEAFNSGKWANGLRRVGKAGWQSATVAKAGNFATGVSAAEAKVASAFGPLLQFEAGVQSAIASMPNQTLDQRIARSAEWQRRMAAYQRPS
jgi:hypothetical protein